MSMLAGIDRTYSIDRFAKTSEYDRGCLCPYCILRFLVGLANSANTKHIFALCLLWNGMSFPATSLSLARPCG